MVSNWKSQADKQIALIENEHNKKIVKKYRRWMEDKEFADKAIADKLRILVKMSNAIGIDFKEITVEDMDDYVHSDEFTLNAKTEKEMSKSSIDRYKIVIRTFYKWIYANFGKDRNKMESSEYPEVVEFELSKNNNQKLPEDLLTKEEVLAMIEAADNLRDQTLIALLYDSMGRISEVLGLNETDVHADKYGFYIVIKDKTSKTFGRRIRLHVSVPYLKLYLNSQEKDKPLFKSRLGNRLSDTRTRDIVKNYAKDAGIQKRVHPHLLRHSKATELAGKLTEQQLKTIGGWKADSRMTGVYVHLSGADTDRAQLEMYNLIPDDEEAEIDPLAPKICPRCQHDNPATQTSFCAVCGFSLSEDVPYDTEFDILKREMEISEIENDINNAERDMKAELNECESNERSLKDKIMIFELQKKSLNADDPLMETLDKAIYDYDGYIQTNKDAMAMIKQEYGEKIANLQGQLEDFE